MSVKLARASDGGWKVIIATERGEKRQFYYRHEADARRAWLAIKREEQKAIKQAARARRDEQNALAQERRELEDRLRQLEDRERDLQQRVVLLSELREKIDQLQLQAKPSARGLELVGSPRTRRMARKGEA